MEIVNDINLFIGGIAILTGLLSGAYYFVLQLIFCRKYLPNARKKARQILPVNRRFITSWLLYWPTNGLTLRWNYFNSYMLIVGNDKYRHHKLIQRFIPQAEQKLCRRAYVASMRVGILSFLIMFLCLGINYLITTYFLH